MVTATWLSGKGAEVSDRPFNFVFRCSCTPEHDVTGYNSKAQSSTAQKTSTCSRMARHVIPVQFHVCDVVLQSPPQCIDPACAGPPIDTPSLPSDPPSPPAGSPANCRLTNGSSMTEVIAPGAIVTNTKQCPKEDGKNMALVDFSCESDNPNVVAVQEDTSMLMLPFPNRPDTTFNPGFKIYGGATCKCAPAFKISSWSCTGSTNLMQMTASL